MKPYLVLFLLLSGCMSVYEPKLSSPALDHDRYTADLDLCRQETHDRIINAGYSPEGVAKSSIIGGFGLIGAVGIATTSDNNDDYNKTGFTMIDECMSKKGYNVVRN